ncbi:hypothetical protein J3B02_003302 [Coemansia erecta]|uniref:Uncharacterized protein n=1 Tax=Coemansia asiatica TaxID=1052880 RepID=A0A9W8CJT8_9FUNG|nr:hypothetical protein LPJ64_003648 [Coemansia asiatica]KAJ2853069.1 hypothetical protein J3B02_003302 [Coemansia erecta]KAJ2881105.1 hypothetical protein FB639_002690 [Coemansia asiatica]
MATTYRQALIDDEEPPSYTPFPRPEEQSLDAGAGAPIVRAQPSQIVINPSDPRSHFARQFFGNSNIPPLPPRRAETPGPVPINPSLPSRLNAGYEQMETPPHLTPRAQPSISQLTQPTVHVGAVTSDASPLNRPVTSGVFQNCAPGPAIGNVSYSTLRDTPTSLHHVRGQGHWSQRLYGDSSVSSWPARPVESERPSGTSTPAVVALSCPACRNTGWIGLRTPCTCPLGIAAKNHGPRVLQSSLLGILEDILAPSRYPGAQYAHQSSQSAVQAQPPASHAHLIPGTGSLCPNCTGRSYFRNTEMLNHPVTREMERIYGSLPPPCSVCCDRGRLG